MGLLDNIFKSKPPSEEQFAKMLMESIQRAGETGAIHFDPEEYALTNPNKGVLNLGNAYREYCSTPQDARQDVFDKWVRGWFVVGKPAPEDYEDVRHDLLPVVRGRAYFDLTELELVASGKSGLPCPYQPLGEHLAVGLVYDMREAMRSIQQEDLDAWGVTFYEAMEVAMDNLRQLPMQFIGPEKGSGVYLSANNDDYDASRLLLTDLIGRFNLDGDPIAMVPARNALMIAGADDVNALKDLLTLAEGAVQKQSYVVSTVALRLQGDDWEPWLPDSSHPLYNEFKRMHVELLADEYETQKALLAKLHEARGEDLFVAKFDGLQNKNTGNVTSCSVWGAGVATLLPQTDLIAFLGRDGEPHIFDWERAVEVVSSLMTSLDMYPPRFKVSDYPTEEQFAAMGEEVKL